MWARNYKPDIFLVGEPFFFQKEVYMSLLMILNFLKENLELLGPFQVASGQLNEWLKGDEEDVHLVFD